MQYKDRMGKLCGEEDGQDKLLQKMYGCAAGRGALKILVQPFVSKIGGILLDTRLSAKWIPGFVRAHQIDLSIYHNKTYKSYNDFFTRKIKSKHRPIDLDKTHLISPCDSKLSVSPITEKGTFLVKGTKYTLASLLRDRKLAEHYEGGTLLLFRLTVDDYHRYCYVDSGRVGGSRRIQGVYHSVNPAANDNCPIYKENTREYTLLKSNHFGPVVMMEVGALLVGKIHNYLEEGRVQKGQEKGKFEFGGSTVILLLEKDRVELDLDIQKNASQGYETQVKYGEKIGCSLS